MSWKKYIPPTIKRSVKILLKQIIDRKANTRFAKAIETKTDHFLISSLQQKIIATPTSQNKKHNLAIALQKINGLTIFPGETFSFWKLVQCPSLKNGFKKGRSIIADNVQEDVGVAIIFCCNELIKK